MARRAVIVGVTDYTPNRGEKPGLQRLPAGVNDAEAIAQVLKDPAIGDFEVTLLKNPTAAIVQQAIDELFSTAHADDTLLLYFSGHGVKDDAGKLFFAACDTEKYPTGKLKKSTAIAASFIQELMSDSDARRRVIILDCCFSGAFSQGLIRRGDEQVDLKVQLGGEGWVLLASSSSTQYSLEQEGQDLAVYTRYLVEGIQAGAADTDEDGYISAEELHDYVAGRVQKAAPTMKPERYAYKTGEKILLAKAPVNRGERQYRKEVAKRIRQGKIGPAARKNLDIERARLAPLGLSATRADEIEQDALKPYEEYKTNLAMYRQTFQAEIQNQYPLDATVRQDLIDLQQQLNLRPIDVAELELTTLQAAGISPSFEAEPAALPLEVAPESHLVTFEVVTVDDRGVIIQRDQCQAQQICHDLGKGITLMMVAIPRGEFLMGSAEPEGDADERPQHRVKVPAFYMGQTPITQAQYQVVMGKNPSTFAEQGADRPVEKVSWYEAVEFCARLEQQIGIPYRLPSEAEWEYACRAGTTTPFHYGVTITPDLVNYNGNFPYGNAPRGNYRKQTIAVRSFPPNAFGLHDLHGNVWEWCADNWHDSYQGAPLDGSVWKTSKPTSDPHVLRGGSWILGAADCRASSRDGVNPDAHGSNYGFRVAYSLES